MKSKSELCFVVDIIFAVFIASAVCVVDISSQNAEVNENDNVTLVCSTTDVSKTIQFKQNNDPKGTCSSITGCLTLPTKYNLTQTGGKLTIFVIKSFHCGMDNGSWICTYNNQESRPITLACDDGTSTTIASTSTTTTHHSSTLFTDIVIAVIITIGAGIIITIVVSLCCYFKRRTESNQANISKKSSNISDDNKLFYKENDNFPTRSDIKAKTNGFDPDINSEQQKDDNITSSDTLRRSERTCEITLDNGNMEMQKQIPEK